MTTMSSISSNEEDELRKKTIKAEWRKRNEEKTLKAKCKLFAQKKVLDHKIFGQICNEQMFRIDI